MFDFLCSFLGCNGSALKEGVEFVGGIVVVFGVLVGLSLSRPKMVLLGIVGLSAPFIGFAGVWMTLSMASQYFGGAALPMPGLLGNLYPYAVAFWFIPAVISLITVLAVANGLSWVLVELTERKAERFSKSTHAEDKAFAEANPLSKKSRKFNWIDGWVLSISYFLGVEYSEEFLDGLSN